MKSSSETIVIYGIQEGDDTQNDTTYSSKGRPRLLMLCSPYSYTFALQLSLSQMEAQMSGYMCNPDDARSAVYNLLLQHGRYPREARKLLTMTMRYYQIYTHNNQFRRHFHHNDSIKCHHLMMMINWCLRTNIHSIIQCM